MDQTPFIIHTYKRYWGRWNITTDVEFHGAEDFHKSEILRNTIKYNDFLKERGDNNITPEFLETLDVSNKDPHFPEVKVSGGPKFFTEEEYREAKDTVANMENRINNVIDLDGIMTTPDAEFDRAMIYESTQQAKKIIESFEDDLELAKIVEKLQQEVK